MHRRPRIAALVAISGAILAALPGCEGTVLDLGSQQGSSCPEIVIGANLTNADFGTGPSADCVRFFAQTAADLDQLMYTAELDVGAACDAIAIAGGVTVSASPDIRSRCDVAVAALTGSDAYTKMGPFAPFVSAPGTCTPGPTIPCGACTESCDESSSANARASCSPPVFRIEPTGSTLHAAVLDSLQLDMPLIIALTTDRGEELQRTLDDILASQSSATSGGHLDLRGAVCMQRTASLLLDAGTHLSAARTQARRIVNSLADAK